MNTDNNYKTESNEGVISIAMLFFGFLGCFFLCLNPADSATQTQFFFGLLASKAAMLASWAIAVRLYRKLYC